MKPKCHPECEFCDYLKFLETMSTQEKQEYIEQATRDHVKNKDKAQKVYLDAYDC